MRLGGKGRGGFLPSVDFVTAKDLIFSEFILVHIIQEKIIALENVIRN